MSHQIHVELVLNQLDLLPYTNKLVGSLHDATRKTFEIAKKITIAVELAANPSLILLEEPLSAVAIGNGMAGTGTGSAAELLMYWIVLLIFTLCMTYFGMMITFLSPVPTLAAFAMSIVTSLWVSASGLASAHYFQMDLMYGISEKPTPRKNRRRHSHFDSNVHAVCQPCLCLFCCAEAQPPHM
ncbi:hypothetical protein FEM48_Zijuj02G0125300 [Ziziphus jujuba var. spinosa]|uniref:Uncharacterized protein n=1 Tax=Ziziphus jujuba var. spinosa TaxID=714518 RepID=A0A978VVR5_ZIZJJ|nr:hypothetical protein FEM48_Zijuj02G0125300 [Ziziphus jujuba var. spinosa]